MLWETVKSTSFVFMVMVADGCIHNEHFMGIKQMTKIVNIFSHARAKAEQRLKAPSF